VPTVALAPEDARRALYIDFEGRKDRPPILLGCTRRSRVRGDLSVWQAITDPRFESLAQADGLESLTLADAVARILIRAEAKDRLIVAWSQHELDVVGEYAPEHLDRFAAKYVNARTFAVRWRNKCHAGARPASNTLADYLALTGYRVPEGAGPGRAGETIGIVERAFDGGRTASDLTDNQRRRWRDLREHNRHDCTGMRSVCTIAADAIATADRRDESRPARVDGRHVVRSRAELA
jgi:hypothetical protein